MTHEDDKIKIEIKQDLTIEEAFHYAALFFTMCGYEIELPNIEDEEDYLMGLWNE